MRAADTEGLNLGASASNMHQGTTRTPPRRPRGTGREPGTEVCSWRDFAVKVYLVRITERRHVFYSEGPETVEEPASDRSPEGRRGLRSWLERKLRYWQLSIRRSKQGAGAALRTVWDWLQRFVGPDETLLRGLRHAREVRLHHPAAMSPQTAQSAWRRYLKGRWTHHLTWLLVDLILSIASIALMILPGPNVVGYWLVYRAGCHALALFGVRRASNRQIVTELEPTGALDLPIGHADRDAVDRMADHCGLKDLDVFLVRVGVNGSSSPGHPGPAIPPDHKDAPATSRAE
jgi:hypothetical protein